MAAVATRSEGVEAPRPGIAAPSTPGGRPVVTEVVDQARLADLHVTRCASPREVEVQPSCTGETSSARHQPLALDDCSVEGQSALMTTDLTPSSPTPPVAELEDWGPLEEATGEPMATWGVEPWSDGDVVGRDLGVRARPVALDPGDARGDPPGRRPDDGHPGRRVRRPRSPPATRRCSRAAGPAPGTSTRRCGRSTRSSADRVAAQTWSMAVSAAGRRAGGGRPRGGGSGGRARRSSWSRSNDACTSSSASVRPTQLAPSTDLPGSRSL